MAGRLRARGSLMVKAKAQAFTAGWAKQAILDAVPNDIDFSEADISPNDRAAVSLQLER